MSYIELHARSAFSFLRGASHPEQLAEVAAELDMPAMAVCDRDGFYGSPRFFKEATERKIKPIVGVELTMEEGAVLPVLVENRAGYQNLCQLLTRAHLRNEKGQSRIVWEELSEFANGLVVLTGDEEGPLRRALQKNNFQKAENHLRQLCGIFGAKNIFVEIQRHHIRGEDKINRLLIEIAEKFRLPLLATNGVLYANSAGRQVMDVFTCIRNHTHLDAAGKLLAQNSERFLKNEKQMRELFRDLPEAIENTSRLAERLEFQLNNLGYEFPRYPVPVEHNADSFLREQTLRGARNRYGGEIPEKVFRQINDELALISKLGVTGYFLIVWDIVEFCAQQNIMAQGRGSAANSSVCYCLGITNVDPLKFHTLFERFLSEGRKNCWPDIDIDLPSGDRREKVIQEVYKRYGKHGAAMTANVICYRGRSAAREIGKALNISDDVLGRFSDLFANGDFPHTLNFQLQMKKAGLPLEHPRTKAFAALYLQLTEEMLPRHLGQHSGGMIICQDQLSSVVPLENASMPGRVVAQWDKDDCEELGIIKVDFLGLGMMSVIQDAVELARQRGDPIDLGKLPPDDPKTFEMIRAADTIGVFQIESRAQMATLPRMKPKDFYDLCIEIAIIRPGPIQGNLMHPYLKRRKEVEHGADPKKMPCYHEDLRPVLERTLGIPLFQEQMLEMATKMTDFTASEAEELRRALSFHRSDKEMKKVEKKLRDALQRKGYAQKVIDEVSDAITSFALYGFPESHAISFAHLAYATAYLKAHRAQEFYASLLNNQPMGFYSSATIVKDGKRHGVKFLPVCAGKSEWSCTIEPDDSIRLGFCVVQGLNQKRANKMLEERAKQNFNSIGDFKLRTRLNKEELRTLAEIGALNCLAKHRREALWEVEREILQDDLFELGTRNSELGIKNNSPLLPMNCAERLRADYSGTNLTTGPHPMALLRKNLESQNIWRASDLPKAKHGQIVRIAGNVICRQRPGTAKGFVFITLEDETGMSNAIVAPKLFEKLRLVITQESFLLIEGRLQNSENVILIQAQRIERLIHENLAGSSSYDFH
jgi:error-prone DNA polymerase